LSFSISLKLFRSFETCLRKCSSSIAILKRANSSRIFFTEFSRSLIVFLSYFWGACIVYWLTTQPFSVIEEKGEGFEKRKNSSWLLVLPSTLALQYCVVRLKIHFSYKNFTEYKIIYKLKCFLAYSQNAFQDLILIHVKLLGKPRL